MTEQEIIKLYSQTDMSEEELTIMLEKLKEDQWEEQYHETMLASIEIMEKEVEAYNQYFSRMTARPQKGKMRDLYGYGLENVLSEKEYKETDYCFALDLLRAIPSEIEVMLYLHDHGKILIPPTYHKYNMWIQKNGVDICFTEKERPQANKGYMAFVDAKNADLRQKDDKNFQNLFLEIVKWNAWGRHYETQNGIVPPNRYLAYVRDGKRYGETKNADGTITGGQMATEIPGVYSDDKTEDENRRDIIEYYFNRLELLDHDIVFVRGEDMNNWIETIVSERKRNGVRTDKELSPTIPIWKKKYKWLEVARDERGWKRISGDLDIVAQPFDLAETRPDNLMEDKFKRLETKQANGLQMSTVMAMENVEWKDDTDY